ncbi:hypothetical protein LX81_04146 [Palleronia aestuarii]|uniref:Uncharacterized protein n=1 Tax=Palleronia aestuarii TaxID=568105 RepID=A0A2W7NHA5_9RHOB|nr:hypothetical protein LX81_04146 [Palleronia aestuarii]
MIRELKRRYDVFGILSKSEGIVRIVGALMFETNDEWLPAQICISLETLTRVTDNPGIKLPVVAT